MNNKIQLVFRNLQLKPHLQEINLTQTKNKKQINYKTMNKIFRTKQRNTNLDCNPKMEKTREKLR